MSEVTEPYMVHDLGAVVGELLLGKWVIYAHEWLPVDRDINSWIEGLRTRGEAAGLAVGIFTVPRHDMTIAWNEAAPPTVEQIDTSVQAIKYHRFVERSIGSELLVKTGRPGPYEHLR